METFNRDEHKEFSPIWRGRSRKESVCVFNDDGDLLGFILIFENQRCLKYIAVDPRFQSLGLGSILLNYALQRCIEQRVDLSLVPANARVQAWYERQGFVVTSWFTEPNGKVSPNMVFHVAQAQAQAQAKKNLKRFDHTIQNGRACTSTKQRCVAVGGRAKSADRAAGTSEPVYDYQDVAGLKQGVYNAKGAGAREDEAHEGLRGDDSKDYEKE
jgi:GNAT superfamily N-acetyltransferase